MNRIKIAPWLIMMGVCGYVILSKKAYINDAISLIRNEITNEDPFEVPRNDIIDTNQLAYIDEMFETAVNVERPHEEISSELLDMGYEFEVLDSETMLSRNPDTIGKIVLEGTKIDYPLVQGYDNEYYLHHSIDGEESIMASIFQDCRNTPLSSPTYALSDVNVIYGHHIQNGLMFSGLDNYKKQEFYDEHPMGIIYTIDGYAYKLDIFGGVIVTPEDSNIYHSDFQSESEFNEFVNNIKSNSLIETNVDVNYGDKLIALVVCSYENNQDLRFVVFAKATKQYTNEIQKENDKCVPKGRL